ncbi:MAG: hypothetical protein ACRD12_08110 [Acidimicrobiales bacterium]
MDLDILLAGDATHDLAHVLHHVSLPCEGKRQEDSVERRAIESLTHEGGGGDKEHRPARGPFGQLRRDGRPVLLPEPAMQNQGIDASRPKVRAERVDVAEPPRQ